MQLPRVAAPVQAGFNTKRGDPPSDKMLGGVCDEPLDNAGTHPHRVVPATSVTKCKMMGVCVGRLAGAEAKGGTRGGRLAAGSRAWEQSSLINVGVVVWAVAAALRKREGRKETGDERREKGDIKEEKREERRETGEGRRET